MTAREPTPVLVGVAQVSQCSDDPATAAEPLDLMIRATHATACDAGAPALLTKHAFGLFASEPPARAYRHDEPQEQVDAMPTRELAESAHGPAEIESYTVMFGREVPPSASPPACALTAAGPGRTPRTPT